jgi:hypothetical protein
LQAARGRRSFRRLSHTYSVGLRPASIPDVAEVDQALVAELEARADESGRVAWLPLAREYVEGASYVQKAVREALSSLETESLERIGAAIKAYKTATSIPPDMEKFTAMAVAKVGPRWSLTEVRAIDFDYEEQVDDLRAANEAPMVNLHLRQFLT